MSSKGDSGADPFSFFQEKTGPSWYQHLIWDLNEFLVKSFGLDPFVWMGRIVVSLVLMYAWDAYWAPPKKPKRALKEQPTQEIENTVNASESLETLNSSEPQQQSPQLPESESQSKEKEEEEEEEKPTIEEVEIAPNDSISKSAGDTATNESPAKVTENVSKIDTPKGIAKSTTDTSPSNSNSAFASNINPWATKLDGFHYWYEVETSLYRIYTLAHRDPSIPTIPPYLANSKRGNVAVAMKVTNRTHRDINVYWVDYKGKHVPKGRISKHSGVWTQTTWIDHPWVMQDANTGALLLYFVPYKVIPTIPFAPTLGPDGRSGLFAFDIIEADETHNNSYWIGISDKPLPYPSSTHFDTPLKAIHWTLQHLSRHAQASRTDCFAVETATLQKYLLNIMDDPSVWKYRNLKLSSKHFVGIWNSPLRGLLLAVGFVEDRGYCSLGVSDAPISSDKVQEIALLSYLLNEWTRKATGNNNPEQPQPMGAMDGYGRAGFGRAGAMQ